MEQKQRQRIRIRPKPTEAPQAAPPSTPRTRVRTPEPRTPDVPVTTPSPRRPTPVTTQRPTLSSSDAASKQTFGQSLSGIFDPAQLTVFGDNRVSLVRQETPQQQFRMPDIPKVRTLAGPKIVSRPVEISDVSQDIDQQRFLPVQELVREEPRPAAQKPVQQVQPFTHFQAQQQQTATQPRPLPFQAQPAIPQPQPAVPQQPQVLNRQPQPAVPQPAVPQPQQISRSQPAIPQPQQIIRQSQPAVPQPQQIPRQPKPALPQPQPSFTAQQFNRQQPQPAVPQPQLNRQPQPEIRQPQPIPFQTRPATPRQLALPQPSTPQQQASSDFFKDTLFSQPIEIPSNAGGASFSYEAILG